MSLYGNLPYNNRLVQDGSTTVTVALPAGATTGSTSGIDLRQSVPYPVTTEVIAYITTTASSGSANSKNLNVVFQDSADGVTYANVATFANPVLRVTDSSTITPAGSSSVVLPSSIRQYVRLSITGETNGGTPLGTGSLALLY